MFEDILNNAGDAIRLSPRRDLGFEEIESLREIAQSHGAVLIFNSYAGKISCVYPYFGEKSSDDSKDSFLRDYIVSPVSRNFMLYNRISLP